MPLYHLTFWQYLSDKDGNIDNQNIDHRIAILEQVAEGVKYLQSRKVKHLDMKPSNILIALRNPNEKEVTQCCSTQNKKNNKIRGKQFRVKKIHFFPWQKK